jgi:hypothetical protein
MGTSTLAEPLVLTGQQRALIGTLLYFDVFRHPLRKEELMRFLGRSVRDPQTLTADLDALCADGTCSELQGFYGFGELAAAIEDRHADNQRAAERMNKAHRMSRLIGKFPFVRGVMLSGSISKGRVAEDGDIDYFVITEPGRLWIARTLLIAFKKLFLFNSHRDFCVNYFVDTDHLAIEDRNLFTATEVMTLIPTWNGAVCEAFFDANVWASALLPNAVRPSPVNVPGSNGRAKRLIEKLLRTHFGDEVDEWCMLRTLKHWRSKFAELDRARFDIALRTRKYVSKHHPRDFQRRVLEAYALRITSFETEHGLSLTATNGA